MRISTGQCASLLKPAVGDLEAPTDPPSESRDQIPKRPNHPFPLSSGPSRRITRSGASKKGPAKCRCARRASPRPTGWDQVVEWCRIVGRSATGRRWPSSGWSPSKSGIMTQKDDGCGRMQLVLTRVARPKNGGGSVETAQCNRDDGTARHATYETSRARVIAPAPTDPISAASET